jgi:stalled ribosome rescue protein Dom34
VTQSFFDFLIFLARAMQEMKVLQLFFDTLKINSDKVAYGVKDVSFACQQKAISHLLISDTLSRTRVI